MMGPCSEKCICYLSRTLLELKNKIEEQSKILSEFTSSDVTVRCNVELTASEEKLFGPGNVKDDSMVCCILVRELRAQKRDLEVMMVRWVEFADKADRFPLIITELRDKLTELTSRIDSILEETKVSEEIELVNEETRGMEIDKLLKRSEERREIFRETVHRYEEAETRHHLEHLARREKLGALERDRLIDRAALKLALERMMKITSIQELSEFTVRKTEMTSEKILSLNPTTTETNTSSNNPTTQIIDSPQSVIHDNFTQDKYIRKPDKICPWYFSRRTTPRHPF